MIPAKFHGEIKAIIKDQGKLDMFSKALKAENVEDSAKELPGELSELCVTSLVAFIDKYEEAEILKKLNKELEEMTTDIDQKRAEVKAKRAANPSAPKKASPERDSSSSSKRATSSSKKAKKAKKGKAADPSKQSTEERFRNLIKEVQKRVDEIELKKGDYQTYAEVQGEVDAFLGEAVSDILAIKASLKKRFDAAQKGRTASRRQSDSRSKSRKPRNRADRRRSPTDAGPGAKKPANAESVFSTDQIHHAD